MTEFAAEIDNAARLVGLEIPAAYRPGVAQFLGIAREMAGVLEAVALDEDELALAPVWRLPDLSA